MAAFRGNDNAHMGATLYYLVSVLVFVTLVEQSSGCANEPSVYLVTIRDFLPIWCMPVQEFMDLGIDDPDTEDPHSLRLETYKKFQKDALCPYQDYINRGELSGHPDFNRPYIPGWDMNHMFDLEDIYGVNDTFVSGSCDLSDVKTELRRPPHLEQNTSPERTHGCRAAYKAYTSRMNYTQMDVASSGLPKPQYCTSNPSGRCGYFLKNLTSGFGRTYQTANKYFQDMWFNDHKKFNKRLGSTLYTKEKAPACIGVFEFNSDVDQENPNAKYSRYGPHAQPELIFNEAQHPDPFEAKVWPMFNSSRNPLKGATKYLHTTEIHTFFEYRGEEVFSFAGDDDVWVYINGILGIELGGVHKTAEQTIDLGRQAARRHFNITPGNVYTFDLFHAERQPLGSSFKITTTLVPGCNVLTSRKAFFPNERGSIIKACRGVDFDFAMGAVYAGEEIGLLPAGSIQTSSFIFVQEKINVASGFIIDFTFRATGNPEGFAFVLHQRREGLKNLPISSGGSLGFKGINHSLAIAFDLCSDRTTDTYCAEQRVGVHYPKTPEGQNKPGLSTRRVHDNVLRSLRYGEEHRVRIVYYMRPSALEVIIDESLYLRDFPFNPRTAFGSVAAFGGFTAAAGEQPGEIVISNWTMKSVDVDSTTTVAIDFNTGEKASIPKRVIANNIDSAGYSIQTKDKCGFDVEFGNRADNTGGVFVEERNPETGLYGGNRTVPHVVAAIVVDNQDGTYAYNLKTSEPAIFSLHLYYGDRSKRCSFGPNNSGSYPTREGLENDGCFYGTIYNAIHVLPESSSFTRSPTVLTLPPSFYSDTPIYVGAIGGTALGILSFVAIFFVFAYKKQWEWAKQYVETGELYKMDADTALPKNDKTLRIGHQILSTRAAIMWIRSGRNFGALEEEWGCLETENEELKEQIYQFERRMWRKLPANITRTKELDL